MVLEAGSVAGGQVFAYRGKGGLEAVEEGAEVRADVPDAEDAMETEEPARMGAEEE